MVWSAWIIKDGNSQPTFHPCTHLFEPPLLNGSIARVMQPMETNPLVCHRCLCLEEEVAVHVIDRDRAERTSAVLDTPSPYIAGVWLNAICDHVSIQIIVAEAVRHIVFDNTLDHQAAKLVECQAAVESMNFPPHF